MQLFKKFTVNLIFLFLLCGNVSVAEILEATGTIETSDETEIIETVNAKAGWYEKNFKNWLLSLTHDGDTVHFRFKEPGRGFNTEKGYRHEFSLKEGETFRSAFDDHGSSQYLLKEVGLHGITIQYESEFDHRSFGPDEITIDKGTFRLPYINSPE